MRRSVITGGTDDGIRRLEEDVERLEAEALRLIQAVQQLKDSAESMDEWLHESYSLLPDILTWGLIIAWANKRHLSDELDKYHRVLDEFQADIGTTFTIPCCAPRGNDNLADAYAISPLLESETIDEAISKIRGIYRGRSIIPRVWYERAKTSLERLKETRWQRPEQIILQRADDGAPLSPTDYAALNEVDLSQAFGRAMTANSKENNWPFLGMLFDYWDSDADAKNQ
jgi:hypothetical protein